MRVLIAVLLTFVISGSLLAQEKDSFVGLLGGASFPVGKYAAKNLDDGSFTMPGFTVGIEGAWFFKPWLGVGGQFGLNFHPVDVSSLGYEKVKNDPFLQDVTIRSDPYQIITGTIGLFSQWNFWKKLSLQGKILGGMMWAKTPYQLYKPEYFLVGPEYFEITSSKDWNLAITAGAGIQIDVSSCIAFRIDADYTYSKMVFGFRTASQTRYEYRTISFINTSLLLVIKL